MKLFKTKSRLTAPCMYIGVHSVYARGFLHLISDTPTGSATRSHGKPCDHGNLVLCAPHSRPTSIFLGRVMGERWVPVISYEESYEVSDQGHVRSIPRKVAGRGKSVRTLRGKLLSPRVRPDGTRAVNLWRGNKYVQKPVKRVVLESFGSPQPTGYDAKNRNGDPADNRLSNLSWEPLAGLALLHRRLTRR